MDFANLAFLTHCVYQKYIIQQGYCVVYISLKFARERQLLLRKVHQTNCISNWSHEEEKSENFNAMAKWKCYGS